MLHGCNKLSHEVRVQQVFNFAKWDFLNKTCSAPFQYPKSNLGIFCEEIFVGCFLGVMLFCTISCQRKLSKFNLFVLLHVQYSELLYFHFQRLLQIKAYVKKAHPLKTRVR